MRPASARSVLIFAYGSIMDEGQMRDRCANADSVSTARFVNHRLCFPRWSKRWQCHVAGFEPVSDHDLWGVVWKVRRDELPTLDQWEGFYAPRHTSNSYERQAVQLQTANGAAIDAETYAAIPQTCGLPSAKYLGYLISGACRWGLPPDYIRELEHLPYLT